MNDLLSQLPEALAWTLLHSLWQGVLIAAVLWLGLKLLSPASAARYPLAVSALLLLVIIPAFTLTEQLTTPEAAGPRVPAEASTQPPGPVPTGPAAHAEPATAAEPARQDGAAYGVRWAPLLVLAWLSGSLLLSLRLLGGFLLLHRLRSRGLTLPEAPLAELFERLAARLQLSGRVAFRLSGRAAVPLVTGIVKPLVLLPVSAASGLATRDLELLLAHELAHVRRNDLLVNTVQRLVETLLYFHPATWWISRVITDEREAACDQLAVAVTGADRREYAATLLRVGEQQAAPTLSAAATGGSLPRRVRRLLGQPAAADRFVPLLVAGLLTLTAGWLLASQAQSEPAAAGYRTLWVTVHPAVEFNEDYSGVANVPADGFVLLEERHGNELRRRALLTAPGTTAEQAAGLAGGLFSRSVDEPTKRIWFDSGSLGSAAVDADWVAVMLQRTVLDPLREAERHGLPQPSDGFTAIRTSGPERFESFVYEQYRARVPFLYGEQQADSFAGQVPQVRLTTHLLAHGLVNGDAALQFLFDVLRFHEQPALPLIEDILLLVPFLPADNHRLELLEALALQITELPASLRPQFQAAVSSFTDTAWAEQSRQVFSEDYLGRMNAALLPLTFAIGTLNAAGSSEANWYAEVVPAGYVERTLDFQVEAPDGQLLHQQRPGQPQPYELFGTLDVLPAGHYRLAANWLGRTVESHIEVDPGQLLPAATDVRLVDGPAVSWEPVPGALRYRLDVSTPTGVRVYWLSEPTDSPLVRLEGLLPGRHEVVNVWAYSQPAACNGCQLNASVTQADLAFTVP